MILAHKRTESVASSSIWAARVLVYVGKTPFISFVQATPNDVLIAAAEGGPQS